jgi:hypothetical protein
MYVAVVATIAGQGLVLGNIRVLAYAALLWLFFHWFVVMFEEQVLRLLLAQNTNASAGAFRDGFHASLPGKVPNKFT